MDRYHPLLVALHWLVAIMVLVSLLIGGPMLADMKNSDPEKLTALTGHMIWGMCIGGLMLARLATRVFTRKPPPANTGHSALNFGTQAAHVTLYVLVFAMVGSGLGIAYSADIFAIVFGGSDGQLPASFAAIPARRVHGVVATLILIMVTLHVLGWAYHQFVRRDRLISRMWFGQRVK